MNNDLSASIRHDCVHAEHFSHAQWARAASDYKISCARILQEHMEEAEFSWIRYLFLLLVEHFCCAKWQPVIINFGLFLHMPVQHRIESMSSDFQHCPLQLGRVYKIESNLGTKRCRYIKFQKWIVLIDFLGHQFRPLYRQGDASAPFSADTNCGQYTGSHTRKFISIQIYCIALHCHWTSNLGYVSLQTRNVSSPPFKAGFCSTPHDLTRDPNHPIYTWVCSVYYGRVINTYGFVLC